MLICNMLTSAIQLPHLTYPKLQPHWATSKNSSNGLIFFIYFLSFKGTTCKGETLIFFTFENKYHPNLCIDVSFSPSLPPSRSYILSILDVIFHVSSNGVRINTITNTIGWTGRASTRFISISCPLMSNDNRSVWIIFLAEHSIKSRCGLIKEQCGARHFGGEIDLMWLIFQETIYGSQLSNASKPSHVNGTQESSVEHVNLSEQHVRNTSPPQPEYSDESIRLPNQKSLFYYLSIFHLFICFYGLKFFL